MEHNSSSTSDVTPQFRIPTLAWVLLAAIVLGLLAMFVFKVAVGTVFSYGILGLMILSHLFMHGGHGSHGAHTNQADSTPGDGIKTDQDSSSAGHGGCH